MADIIDQLEQVLDERKDENLIILMSLPYTVKVMVIYVIKFLRKHLN